MSSPRCGIVAIAIAVALGVSGCSAILGDGSKDSPTVGDGAHAGQPEPHRGHTGAHRHAFT